MFKIIWNKIKQYAGLLDDIIQDFFIDLKSFRVQLLYMAYIFNGIMLWAVIMKGVDYKALAISFGTLTVCYAFYFQSKRHQSEMEANQSIQTQEGDPASGERDPDNI